MLKSEELTKPSHFFEGTITINSSNSVLNMTTYFDWAAHCELLDSWVFLVFLGIVDVIVWKLKSLKVFHDLIMYVVLARLCLELTGLLLGRCLRLSTLHFP